MKFRSTDSILPYTTGPTYEERHGALAILHGQSHGVVGKGGITSGELLQALPKGSASCSDVVPAGHKTGWVVASHGPLTRYVKLRVTRAPGMPETFSKPRTSKETAS